MPDFTELPQIRDVLTVSLAVYGDERGSFTETFRREWFPQATWDAVQINRSVSAAGVLRGLHHHFYQVDYWCLLSGKIRVGLADLRPNSATYGVSTTLDLDAATSTGLFIPIGVAHGFYALTDVTLFYVVNQYYNGSDERGVAWDDPDLDVGWGIQSPVLSGRDQANRRLKDIPREELPR